VSPIAGLNDVERRKLLTLPGLGLRPLGRPARSQSLYRLRYPGSPLSLSLSLSLYIYIYRFFESSEATCWMCIITCRPHVITMILTNTCGVALQMYNLVYNVLQCCGGVTDPHAEGTGEDCVQG
jgi:hypothetical protein